MVKNTEAIRSEKKAVQDIAEKYLTEFRRQNLSSTVTLREGSRTCIDQRALFYNYIDDIMKEIKKPDIRFLKQLGLDLETAKFVLSVLKEHIK